MVGLHLSVELIEEAARFLEGRIRETPVEEAPALSDILGAPVTLKLESLQVTGSFKIRGAFFRLSRLTKEERRSGVITCSAGNHGKAVAHAARELGVVARIYVPGSVDQSKYEGMIQLGAEVIKAPGNSYDDAEVLAREEADARGLPFISAFEDLDVMAGNGGTLAREILAQVPTVENVIIPVSGGGLAAGLCFHIKECAPAVRIIACQHELSPSLARSLERGEAVTRLPGIDTLAGGIEGGIGAANFEIIRERVDAVALLGEQALFEATTWMLREHQYLVEPSAAVTVAACLQREVGDLSGPTVVVLSGRNISLPGLRRILAGTPPD